MLAQHKVAIDEFTFRYLSPKEEISHARAHDEIEAAYQSQTLSLGTESEDIAKLFRNNLLGKLPAGSLRERILTLLLEVHQPATITPYNGYGLHASYPSPRSYYPLQFAFVEHVQAKTWLVDMQAMHLQAIQHTPCVNPISEYALLIRTDFNIYNPLYNLFRKSLFALESGHFLCELEQLFSHFGLQIRPEVHSHAICLWISEHSAHSAQASCYASFKQHQHFARLRNSGRFYHGYFPTRCEFTKTKLDKFCATIQHSLTQVEYLFPDAKRFNIQAKLCLRDAPDIQAGIYQYEDGQLSCINNVNPMPACEDFYNYKNFNFSHVPALVFLCVDELAYHCDAQNFLRMNLALGYLSQLLIRALAVDNLVGRPFRSYDQLGMDHLLGNAEQGLRTYYGLMLAKNRSEDAVGVLR